VCHARFTISIAAQSHDAFYFQDSRAVEQRFIMVGGVVLFACVLYCFWVLCMCFFCYAYFYCHIGGVVLRINYFFRVNSSSNYCKPTRFLKRLAMRKRLKTTIRRALYVLFCRLFYCNHVVMCRVNLSASILTCPATYLVQTLNRICWRSRAPIVRCGTRFMNLMY
jgi:hypothetical protein